MLKHAITQSPVRGLVPMGLAAVVVITFAVLAGFDLDHAQQIHSTTLDSAVETLEEGSSLRRVGLLAFAGYGTFLLVRVTSVRISVRPIVIVPLVGFLAVAFFSIAWAVDPAFTLRRVVFFSLLLVGVVATAVLLDMAGVARLTAFVAGVTLLIALAATAAFGYFALTDGEWRLAGVIHPVSLSWFCGLGVLGSLAIARFEPSKRTFWGFVCAAFLVALLLTKTRTGLVATLLGAGVLLLVASRHEVRSALATAATWLALALFMIVLLFPGDQLSFTSLYGNVVRVTSFGRADAVEQIATFNARAPVWEATLDLAAERPLLGWGHNAYSSPGMIPIFTEASGWVPASPHSGYIDAIFSYGAVGLVLLLLLLLGTLWVSLRMVTDRPYYAFVPAVLLWLALNMAFEQPLFYDTPFVAFVVFVLILKVGIFPDAPSKGA